MTFWGAILILLHTLIRSLPYGDRRFIIKLKWTMLAADETYSAIDSFCYFYTYVSKKLELRRKYLTYSDIGESIISRYTYWTKIFLALLSLLLYRQDTMILLQPIFHEIKCKQKIIKLVLEHWNLLFLNL